MAVTGRYLYVIVTSHLPYFNGNKKRFKQFVSSFMQNTLFSNSATQNCLALKGSYKHIYRAI